VEGELILGNISLSIGTKLDRFGSEFGKYLSPIHLPYSQRALPPSNLNILKRKKYPYNYHVYEVIKSFVVLGGPIRGWFEQPGIGMQFKTYNSIIGLIEN
ncbi:3940_t:CDS:1, partial [Scutellospora calospora]